MRLVVTKVLPAAQRGDLAIALAQLASIRQRFPEAKVTAFVRRPLRDGHWFSDADEIAGELFPSDPKLSSSQSLARLVTCLCGCHYDDSTQSFYQACKEADLVVFCGGGSPGGYGGKNLVRNALCPVLLARRAGAPIYFSGLSLAPMSRWLNRKVATWTLNQASYITLREPLSTNVLRELGVKTPYKVTADWAILLQPIGDTNARDLLRRESVPLHRRLFGMNLRDIRAINPEGQPDRLCTPYFEDMRQLVERTIREMDAELLIFSMNQPPASNDLAFADSLIATLPETVRRHVHVLRGDYAPSQLKGMIGQVQAFIGTRLHPSIFAVSMCIPTLTIHDHLKVRGFMSLAGMIKWHLPANGFAIDQALQKLQMLYQRRGAISLHLADQRHDLAQRAAANLQPIEEIAKRTNRPLRPAVPASA